MTPSGIEPVTSGFVAQCLQSGRDSQILQQTVPVFGFTHYVFTY